MVRSVGDRVVCRTCVGAIALDQREFLDTRMVVTVVISGVASAAWRVLLYLLMHVFLPIEWAGTIAPLVCFLVVFHVFVASQQCSTPRVVLSPAIIQDKQ